MARSDATSRTGRLPHVSAVLGGMLLLACSADAPVQPEVADDVDAVIILDDIVFVPERMEVPEGEVLTVRLRNDGGIVHDLVTDEWQSEMVQPGRAVDMEIGPFSETTIAWCSVPGHRDAGMELEIVVVDG